MTSLLPPLVRLVDLPLRGLCGQDLSGHMVAGPGGLLLNRNVALSDCHFIQCTMVEVPEGRIHLNGTVEASDFRAEHCSFFNLMLFATSGTIAQLVNNSEFNGNAQPRWLRVTEVQG